MKKYLLGLLSLVLVFSFANAQSVKIKDVKNTSSDVKKSESLLLATVNIYNATSTKINNNNYKVSFQIYNREGIQSDIRYGIELINASTSAVIDTSISDESLTLASDSSKDISLNYSIPGFVQNGDYKLVIVAQNAAGLPLGYMPAGFPERIVSVNNGVNYPVINSCKISDQNATITPESNINITCDISSSQNMSKLNIGFVTHKSGSFGDILNQGLINQNISINKNSNNSISFTLSTKNNPGTYYTDLFLVNNDKEKISSSYEISYNVAGIYASIQNAILDKANYKKGDTANLEIFWTGNGSTISAKILDNNKNICGTLDQKNNSNNYGLVVNKLKIAIDKNCENAVVNVSILDKDGKVLDTINIDINNPSQKININGDIENIKNSNSIDFNKNYVVVFIVVLVLIGYGILVLKKENEGKPFSFKSDPRNNK